LLIKFIFISIGYQSNNNALSLLSGAYHLKKTAGEK